MDQIASIRKEKKDIRICIFAGTTEGRKLAGFLARQGIRTTVCVATEYGGEMISPEEGIEVLAGRMLPEDIRKLFQEREFDLVIDATHPYAASITESVRDACNVCQIPCHRMNREDSGTADGAVYVENAAAAAEYLKDTEGNILLTTGSKELSVYTTIPDYQERIYARVLPLDASLRSCSEAALPASHIIAMQGPFSEEMNTAMLRSVRAGWMVTKDGGNAGGFAEKVRAAQSAGARVIIIGRPENSTGASYRETIRMLCREYHCQPDTRVSVVGIGPGNKDFMTVAVREAIRKAECLIGAGRMVQEYAGPDRYIFEAVSPEKISGFIRQHPEYGNIAVLMSGDTGFFSGTKKLLPLLKDYQVQVLPGISSMVYLCSRLGKSYEDVTAVSLHGRDGDIAKEVRAHGRIFVLVGGEDGMKNLCRDLREAGLGDVRVYVGERLSYPEERITEGTARELAEGTFDTLSVALIEGSQAEGGDGTEGRIETTGLPDDAFIRSSGTKGLIPMTKSEVRAICLSKLQLKKDSVCWDVGAGTGSVAVEMARIAEKGQVCAIEKEADAASLIRENAEHFQLKNLSVTEGTAPGALADLPVPTHVFIGGSGSRIDQIISLILEKNPQARIVATAIALETIGQLTACCRAYPFCETETVAVNISRDHPAGPWHLMKAQNPIYIFTLQGGRKA